MRNIAAIALVAVAAPAKADTQTISGSIPEVPAKADTLSINGSIRERVEVQNNPRFGLGGAEDQTILLHRLLVHADWRPDPSLRVFVELGNHSVLGNEGFRSPVYRNDLDLHQAFVEVTPADGWRARIGRQEVTLASGRIVAVRDQPNIRRAFDGARLTGAAGDYAIDLFALRPVENREGVFDDRSDLNEALLGGSIGRTLRGDHGRIELTYLVSYQRSARYADATGREWRHSFGLRAARTAGNLQWDWEAWVQRGKVGGQTIDAWTLATDTSYSGPNWPIGLRLGLKANLASGDSSASDGRIGTFNALYPRLNYFSEAAAIAPANVIDVQPSIEFQPSRRTNVHIAWNALWRHRRADAVYLAPFIATTVGTHGRFIGEQIDVVGTWEVTSAIDLRASWTRFWPRNALAAQRARTLNLIVGQITARF
jgi:hypothetical protein